MPKFRLEFEAFTKEANARIAKLEKGINTTGEGAKKAGKKIGFMKNSVNELSDKMKILSTVGLIGIITGLINAGKSLFNFNKELQKTTKLTEDLTKKSGEDLRKFTAQVQATVDVFDLDFKDTLIATNTLAKEMGITFEESLTQIQKGLLEGANASGDLLSNIAEYSTQAKRAGLNTAEFIKILDTQTEKGVFSDKGIDTIKEATIRLGEMPEATKKAIDAIGLSSKKMQEDIQSGNTTFFQSIQKISAQLNKLPPQSAKVGKVFADVFGGAGEDAQSFVFALADINLEEENQVKVLTELEKLKKQDLDNQIKINDLMTQFFGENNTGFSKMISDLTTISVDLIMGLIKGIKESVTWFENLSDRSRVFRTIVATITSNFSLMWEAVKQVTSLIGDSFSSVGDIIEGVFTFDSEKISEGATALAERLKTTFVNMAKATNEELNIIRDEFNATTDEKEAERVTERQIKAVQAIKTISTASLNAEATALALRNQQRIAFDKKLAVAEIKTAKTKAESKKKLNKEIKDDTVQNQLESLRFEKGAVKQSLKIMSSKAIGGFISSIFTSVPFPFNLALVAGANSVVDGIFSSIPAFEQGGVVGGSSFTGDNNLIRVNSAEEVVRRDNPRHILNQGSSGGSSDIAMLASSIDELTDEIRLGEKNINITNEIDVTPTNLLDVNEQGEIDRSEVELSNA